MELVTERKKILFATNSMSYLHYYRSIVQALVERGHAVRFIADKDASTGDSLEPVESFARTHDSFSYGWAKKRTGVSRKILIFSRALRSFRRFLRVQGQSVHYQDRWLKYYFPYVLRGLFKYVPIAKQMLATAMAGRLLRWVEYIIPPVRGIQKEIKSFAPDVVLVGPGNIPYPEDIEYTKAARSLGVPTVTPVFSWDNLTTKEVFHTPPDRLLVWNEAQVREVAEHHENLRTDQLRVVGAAQFDQWFSELTPSTTRDEFCKAHGLRPEDPILLYLGTTRKFSVDEVAIVRAVRNTLRESDEPLKRAQLIVRPHPANFRSYTTIDEKAEDIYVVPKGGGMPNTHDNFQLYYDSLHHSEAIVAGVHTSAMIEACIMDKPLIVLTHRVPKEVQVEVQHFQQFIQSGALELVRNDNELQKTLTNLLEGRDEKKEKREAFVTTFIRPHGRNISAGEKAADEIEQFMGTRMYRGARN